MKLASTTIDTGLVLVGRRRNDEFVCADVVSRALRTRITVVVRRQSHTDGGRVDTCVDGRRAGARHVTGIEQRVGIDAAGLGPLGALYIIRRFSILELVSEKQAVRRRDLETGAATTHDVVAVADDVVGEEAIDHLRRIRCFVIDAVSVRIGGVGVVVNKVLIILVIAHERAVDELAVAVGLNHPVGTVVGLCDVVGKDAVCDGDFVLRLARELTHVAVVPGGISFEPAAIEPDHVAGGG